DDRHPIKADFHDLVTCPIPFDAFAVPRGNDQPVDNFADYLEQPTRGGQEVECLFPHLLYRRQVFRRDADMVEEVGIETDKCLACLSRQTGEAYLDPLLFSLDD